MNEQNEFEPKEQEKEENNVNEQNPDIITPDEIQSEETTSESPENSNINSSYNASFNDESYRKAIEEKPKRSKALIAISITTAVVCFIGIIAVSYIGISRYVSKIKNGTNNQVVSQSTNNENTNTVINIAPKDGNALTRPQIYQKVSPSVVSIVVDANSSGSGIIMSADGYIMTNAHVVSGGNSFKVITSTEKEYTAKLIGYDTRTDLAVIKVDATGLTPAEFGDSSKVLVGEDVVALGSPFGIELASTFTSGIISAVRKNINLGERSMDLLQTDAAINPGNSGGPLVNALGQVIGINSLKIISSSEGLGFAIPINVAKPIVEGLMKDGYIKGRPMLGITGRFITADEGATFGYPKGIFVNFVDPSSDAAAKGLKRSDVITKINDKDFADFDEFTKIKEGFTVGEIIKITYFRDGQTTSINIKLAESKPEQ